MDRLELDALLMQKMQEAHVKWKERAIFVEKEYGVHVDWNEHFFLCPKCNTIIYDSPLLFIFPEDSKYVCPICREF